MDKITFRFTLLEARFPNLYRQASEKIQGGMERKDVVTDWLLRMECLEEFVGHLLDKPKTTVQKTAASPETDLDAAKSVMSSLLD